VVLEGEDDGEGGGLEGTLCDGLDDLLGTKTEGGGGGREEGCYQHHTSRIALPRLKGVAGLSGQNTRRS
jgi:hypothetical protein